MLQDLCPGCGSELLEGARTCPACGFDWLSESARENATGGVRLGPFGLAALALAVVALTVVAFGAGHRIGSSVPASDLDEASATSEPAASAPVARVGRVRFGGQLGESMELEGQRRAFSPGDTIAWRAEFAEPPPSAELTVVIEWVSARERMKLSEETVAVRDPSLAMITRDEIAVSDLVPTAGLYTVTYYADGLRLADGVFELLPPDH